MEVTRDEKVRRLTTLLYSNVCLPDYGLERIRTTGALTPTNSLRHRATRKCLEFSRDLDGRWFTYQMVTDAVNNLLSDYQLEIPTNTPGFSRENWVSQTSTTLLHLLQRSRRTVAGSASNDAMDTAETQVLDEMEDSQVYVDPWSSSTPLDASEATVRKRSSGDLSVDVGEIQPAKRLRLRPSYTCIPDVPDNVDESAEDYEYGDGDKNEDSDWMDAKKCEQYFAEDGSDFNWEEEFCAKHGDPDEEPDEEPDAEPGEAGICRRESKCGPCQWFDGECWHDSSRSPCPQDDEAWDEDMDGEPADGKDEWVEATEPEWNETGDAQDEWAEPAWNEAGDAEDEWAEPAWNEAGDAQDEWAEPVETGNAKDDWAEPAWEETGDDEWAEPGCADDAKDEWADPACEETGDAKDEWAEDPDEELGEAADWTDPAWEETGDATDEWAEPLTRDIEQEEWLEPVEEIGDADDEDAEPANEEVATSGAKTQADSEWITWPKKAQMVPKDYPDEGEKERLGQFWKKYVVRQEPN
ncbi:unnamed protein product [Symbiodinium sp. CCMP2456]|nr:unnamed protein product [Symbiodinium sp. CCMP2456]